MIIIIVCTICCLTCRHYIHHDLKHSLISSTQQQRNVFPSIIFFTRCVQLRGVSTTLFIWHVIRVIIQQHCFHRTISYLDKIISKQRCYSAFNQTLSNFVSCLQVLLYSLYIVRDKNIGTPNTDCIFVYTRYFLCHSQNCHPIVQHCI